MRVLAALLATAACTSVNVHDTKKAQNEPCVTCHSAAYQNVQTPVHVGVYPDTCDSCHNTTAWIPTTAGHPEDKFPITTGPHANAAIGCTDCHKPSLGPSGGGANTDCIDCHIGAHTLATVDSAHAGLAGYNPASSATPHSCLAAGCHPNGLRP